VEDDSRSNVIAALVAGLLAGYGIAMPVGAVATYGQARLTPVRPVRAYLELLGMTMLNPITVIYFAALVLGSQTTGPPDHLEQAVFILAAFVASASWQLLVAGSGALLGRVLTGSRGRLATALVSSTLICAIAVHLLTAF
jgi:arginine exporter protein ArgO